MDKKPPKHRRLRVVLAIALCAMSSPAPAQEVPPPPGAAVPTTGSTHVRGEGREGREMRGDREGRRDRRQGGGPRPYTDEPPPAPVSAEEWAQVMASVEKVSPNRWKMLTRMLEGPEKSFHAKVRAGVARRYRELAQLEKADPERHALEVRRDGVEDEIFGLLDGYRRSKSEEIKGQIREKVVALVDVRSELRKLRLERVARELAALRMEKSGEALKAESADSLNPAKREESIDRTLEGFLRHTRPGGPRRPRGDVSTQPLTPAESSPHSADGKPEE